MTGVVTKVEWLNPHARFYIDVVDQSTNPEASGRPPTPSEKQFRDLSRAELDGSRNQSSCEVGHRRVCPGSRAAQQQKQSIPAPETAPLPLRNRPLQSIKERNRHLPARWSERVGAGDTIRRYRRSIGSSRTT